MRLVQDGVDRHGVRPGEGVGGDGLSVDFVRLPFPFVGCGLSDGGGRFARDGELNVFGAGHAARKGDVGLRDIAERAARAGVVCPDGQVCHRRRLYREPRLDGDAQVCRVAHGEGRDCGGGVGAPLAVRDVKRFRIALADVYGVAGGGGGVVVELDVGDSQPERGDLDGVAGDGDVALGCAREVGAGDLACAGLAAFEPEVGGVGRTATVPKVNLER